MEKIEPTHKEIMRFLNCGWFGSYSSKKCMCHDRNAFKECYEKAKLRLTKNILTNEEIVKGIEANKKAMADLSAALDELNGNI